MYVVANLSLRFECYADIGPALLRLTHPGSHLAMKGTTLQGEIMCYGIPYGGIGFASHIITYYTLIALWFGRKPFMPWLPLEHHVWDGIMGFLTFAGGNTLAIFTVIRCRNRWQFVLIAVWKICLSTTLSLTAFTNAVFLGNKDEEDNEFHEGPLPSAGWLVLYVLGLIVGMVGVFSLVKETWVDNSEVRLITYVFGGISGGFIVLAMGYGILGAIVEGCGNDDSEGFLTGIGVFFAAAPVGGVIFFGNIGCIL